MDSDLAGRYIIDFPRAGHGDWALVPGDTRPPDLHNAIASRTAPSGPAFNRPGAVRTCQVRIFPNGFFIPGRFCCHNIPNNFTTAAYHRGRGTGHPHVITAGYYGSIPAGRTGKRILQTHFFPFLICTDLRNDGINIFSRMFWCISSWSGEFFRKKSILPADAKEPLIIPSDAIQVRPIPCCGGDRSRAH
jgi:hypothetical protein